MDVLLQKMGKKAGRAVVGRLLRAPRKGAVVVIEFPDGLHEYVTTPVKRILRIVGQGTYYLQTANSRYRLVVQSGEDVVVADAPAAK
ncbi:MAG: S24/S26 family peptidase [Polyangiales bacterium]|nr:S24/S26 family peptidase [Myxococcales bacterium]